MWDLLSRLSCKSQRHVPLINFIQSERGGENVRKKMPLSQSFVYIEKWILMCSKRLNDKNIL